LNFNKIITYTIILFLGYGVIQFVPTGGIQLSIPVIYETSEILWFNVPLSMLIDLICAPPFIIIMFYYIHKAITEQPETSQPSMKKKDIIKFLLFAAGVVVVAGIIMHAVANQLNGILGNPYPGYDLVIAIYYFDEVLGHKLIHFGIVAFLIGGMITQYWHQKDSQLSRLDLFGLYFWPSAIGIVYALALVEGQAGFDFLVISVVLIVIILYCVKFKGFKLKNNVFTYFILIYLISTVISMIVYGCITGFKPGYPFFYQLSE
jgi:hypothetical protein